MYVCGYVPVCVFLGGGTLCRVLLLTTGMAEYERKAAKSSFSWSAALCQEERDAHRYNVVKAGRRQRLGEGVEKEEE